jgi:hypothetical protein
MQAVSTALIAQYQTQLPDIALLQAKLHELYLQNAPEVAAPTGPDGHFKFPHLWPVKFPQAGRPNYQLFGMPGFGFLSW